MIISTPTHDDLAKCRKLVLNHRFSTRRELYATLCCLISKFVDISADTRRYITHVSSAGRGPHPCTRVIRIVSTQRTTEVQETSRYLSPRDAATRRPSDLTPSMRRTPSSFPPTSYKPPCSGAADSLAGSTASYRRNIVHFGDKFNAFFFRHEIISGEYDFRKTVSTAISK